jgi:hypothetical protein
VKVGRVTARHSRTRRVPAWHEVGCLDVCGQWGKRRTAGSGTLANYMRLAEGHRARASRIARPDNRTAICGYYCQGYSDAVLAKERVDQSLGSGKETTRMLKALHQELGSTPTVAASKIPFPADATAALAPAGYSRENPVEVVFCRAHVSTSDSERFGVMMYESRQRLRLSGTIENSNQLTTSLCARSE